MINPIQPSDQFLGLNPTETDVIYDALRSTQVHNRMLFQMLVVPPLNSILVKVLAGRGILGKEGLPQGTHWSTDRFAHTKFKEWGKNGTLLKIANALHNSPEIDHNKFKKFYAQIQALEVTEFAEFIVLTPEEIGALERALPQYFPEGVPENPLINKINLIFRRRSFRISRDATEEVRNAEAYIRSSLKAPLTGSEFLQKVAEALLNHNPDSPNAGLYKVLCCVKTKVKNQTGQKRNREEPVINLPEEEPMLPPDGQFHGLNPIEKDIIYDVFHSVHPQDRSLFEQRIIPPLNSMLVKILAGRGILGKEGLPRGTHWSTDRVAHIKFKEWDRDGMLCLIANALQKNDGIDQNKFENFYTKLYTSSTIQFVKFEKLTQEEIDVLGVELPDELFNTDVIDQLNLIFAARSLKLSRDASKETDAAHSFIRKYCGSGQFLKRVAKILVDHNPESQYANLYRSFYFVKTRIQKEAAPGAENIILREENLIDLTGNEVVDDERNEIGQGMEPIIEMVDL